MIKYNINTGILFICKNIVGNWVLLVQLPRAPVSKVYLLQELGRPRLVSLKFPDGKKYCILTFWID